MSDTNEQPEPDPPTPIAPQEQIRRKAVDAVQHSIAMEGRQCRDQARADQDAYARGGITVDELIGRGGRASVATDPDA